MCDVSEVVSCSRKPIFLFLKHNLEVTTSQNSTQFCLNILFQHFWFNIFLTFNNYCLECIQVFNSYRNFVKNKVMMLCVDSASTYPGHYNWCNWWKICKKHLKIAQINISLLWLTQTLIDTPVLATQGVLTLNIFIISWCNFLQWML